MASENPNEEKPITHHELQSIVEEALDKQRREIFTRIGEVIGYDVGDTSEMKELRKDLWMLRKTRLRSERFQAIGEKMFATFFWGTLGIGLLTGLAIAASSQLKRLKELFVP